METIDKFLSGDPPEKLESSLFWLPLIFIPLSMWGAFRVWSFPDESLLGHIFSIILLSISGLLLAFFCMYFLSDYDWPNGSSVLDASGMIGWTAFTLSMMGILYSGLLFLFSDKTFLTSDTVPLTKISRNSLGTVLGLGLVFWILKVTFDVSFLRCKKRKLFEAIERGDVAIISAILDKRSSLVNSPSGIGTSPLWEAIVYGHPDLILFFIKHGSDVNFGENLGSTPLHLAADKGWAELARFLLEHGAFVNPINVLGRTPLDEVYIKTNFVPLHSAGYVDIYNILVQHGGKTADEVKRAEITH